MEILVRVLPLGPLLVYYVGGVEGQSWGLSALLRERFPWDSASVKLRLRSSTNPSMTQAS